MTASDMFETLGLPPEAGGVIVGSLMNNSDSLSGHSDPVPPASEFREGHRLQSHTNIAGHSVKRLSESASVFTTICCSKFCIPPQNPRHPELGWLICQVFKFS